METKEKIKIRVDIAKFKVLYFAGVVGASAFLVNSYDKIILIFGHPKESNYLVSIFMIFLITYGIAGIIKNITTLSKIDERLKDE